VEEELKQAIAELASFNLVEIPAGVQAGSIDSK